MSEERRVIARRKQNTGYSVRPGKDFGNGVRLDTRSDKERRSEKFVFPPGAPRDLTAATVAWAEMIKAGKGVQHYMTEPELANGILALAKDAARYRFVLPVVTGELDDTDTRIGNLAVALASGKTGNAAVDAAMGDEQ